MTGSRSERTKSECVPSCKPITSIVANSHSELNVTLSTPPAEADRWSRATLGAAERGLDSAADPK
jgi:hypothetical protein